ncbi:MAG: hypothetical protein CMJ89_15770 [Planctomycetes bacterium]|nr:hypothetical protein [Planctomycetota bacterium]
MMQRNRPQYSTLRRSPAVRLRLVGGKKWFSSDAARTWLGICLGACMGACAGEPALVRAALRCPHPSTDFGTTWEGTLLRAEFELEVGSDPVRILETETDCGCTLTRIERLCKGAERQGYELGDELPAGTRLVLAAEVDTRGKRGRAPRKVHLIVRPSPASIDAVEDERVTLTMWSDVQPWLVSDPARVPILKAMKGEGAQTYFRVRQVDGEAFALRPSRRGLPPWVHVSVQEGEKRLTEHRVDVDIDRETPRLTRSYGVFLESDVENLQSPTAEDGTHAPFSLVQEVSIQVHGQVGLQPPSLSFGVVRSGQTVARTVRVKSYDASFRLEEPQVSLQPLKRDEPFYLTDSASIRARPVGSENAWDVELTLSGLDARIRGNFFARLLVETGHPALPQLEASVSGVALGSKRFGTTPQGADSGRGG